MRMNSYVSDEEPFRIWWEDGGLRATGVPIPEGRPFVCRFEMPYTLFDEVAAPVREEIWAQYVRDFEELTKAIEQTTPFEWTSEEDPPRSGLYVFHGVCMAVPRT